MSGSSFCSIAEENSGQNRCNSGSARGNPALSHAYKILRHYFPVESSYLRHEEIQKLTGWGQDLVDKLLLHRASLDDFENSMVSEGFTHMLQSHEAYKWKEALPGVIPQFRLERDEQICDGVEDILQKIMIEQRRVEQSSPRVLDAIPGRVELLSVGGCRNADPESNIFAKGTREAYLTAVNDIHAFNIETIPKIFSADDLSYYGFTMIDSVHSAPFMVNSPVGVSPIIPVFVGHYYDIRGGYYIEKHQPVHVWAPITPDCGGCITTAKELKEDALLEDCSLTSTEEAAFAANLYRTENTLVSASPKNCDTKKRKLFKFARIEIPFGKILICAPNNWHCDGTLSGGVFLTSFGFAKGPNGDEENTGFISLQPLLTAKGELLVPRFNPVQEGPDFNEKTPVALPEQPDSTAKPVSYSITIPLVKCNRFCLREKKRERECFVKL